MSDSKNKVLTTAFGVPVTDDNNSETAGAHGPVLMQDAVLLDKLSHFGRERIPERVVHAKGAGAFGVFEVTADVSQYTCAHFLGQVGRKTELFVRFSTVAGEKGSADAERDPRGFAIKFYTEEGNYDLVGNNTPIFFIRDPMKFPDFIHSQKKRPQTNLKDMNAAWDFWSLTPESMHQVMILFSDRGVPATFRNMNGYGSHTYMWYNAEGDYVWVKYHFKTDQGVKCLHREEADAMCGKDPDHGTRDLFDSIARGDFPSWTLEVQIATPEQVAKFPFDPFDVTKVWPHSLVPPMTIGKMTLNKNPENYFASVEQSAFNPSNFVPGISVSPDKMLQGRVMSYHDSHLHRLGPNYHLIPVNAPRHAPEQNYQRDGPMRVDDNGGPGANYWPNSFGGPAPAPRPMPAMPVQGIAGRFNQPVGEGIDFSQPSVLYSKVMDEAHRQRYIDNIAASMNGVKERIKLRTAAVIWKMNKDAGERLCKALALDHGQVEGLAKMSFEELNKATCCCGCGNK